MKDPTSRARPWLAVMRRGTRSMGPLFEAVAHFGQEGYLVSVRQTTHPGHAAELVEAEGAQFDRIVCCGGDGTLKGDPWTGCGRPGG